MERKTIAARLGTALAALLMLSAFFSVVAARAQQRTAVRVAYIPVVTWLPALVARDEGIFEKNGLDVTFTKFPTIVNLPQTLGKQFDLVPTTAPDHLNAVASGLRIVAVAGETLETSTNKSFQVLVRADSGINSVKELSGKRVAGPGLGSVMHVAYLHWIKAAGGDPSTVVGVEAPFTAMTDLLKSGRVDAVQQLEPFVGMMLGAGFKSLGDPLLAVADPVLFPFWIADAQWARNNRETVRRWVASLEGGLAIIKSDEAKARKILAAHSGMPEQVVARIPMPHFDFTLRPEQLEVWRQVLLGQGLTALNTLDVKTIVATVE